MKTALLSLIAVMVLSPLAQAASTQGTVARLYPNAGRVYFRLQGDPCKDAGANTYWYFEQTVAESKFWFSMLLAASSNGTVIKLGIPSCVPSQSQEINYIFQDF